MTPNEIDQLTGRELDAVVRIELMKCGRAAADDHFVSYPERIAAAWELDGEGWCWDFTESPWSLMATINFENSIASTYVDAVVKFADFPTKAAAYATARCRVWLKAKQAEAANAPR